MSTATIAADVRQSITPHLRERLVLRIVKDTKWPRDRADHCLDEALIFLNRCATQRGPQVPSRTADVGWHTFLLFTRDYAEFCQQIAGRFIHHDPRDRQSNGRADCDSGPESDCGQGDDTSDNRLDLAVADCDANNCTATDCYQGDDD